MSRRRKADAANNRTSKDQIRCAIYTRKSSEEGLDQEFNSLDAQRESAEAFIASQKAEGWTVLDNRYDDGGFSGGSMERPALDRMLRDIEAGKIDCVVVYKVDRLSRSLLDFSRIMETFENHGVSFVSVTQQFNTTHSMGRLTLNILLSFAQFEREIIGERIRDKIAAQKRKGKWAGGVPVLGYDVDRSGPSPRLVVNAKEAARVREIFRLYLEKESLLAVVTTLREKRWANKRRVTKTGQHLGGRPFDKATLHHLLINPVLIGKIKHKDALYDGEHEPIVDVEVFNKVQALLKHNGRSGGVEVRTRAEALSTGRYWVKRNSLPQQPIEVDDILTQTLQNELSRFHWDRQMRGKYCVVEHYVRINGSQYFFAYLDDYPDKQLIFDDGGLMVPREDRRAFEHIFVFNPEDGSLEMFARGGKAVYEPLQQIFCKTALGLDVDPADPMRPAYTLDHLLSPNRILPTDPNDRIESVIIAKVRLQPIDAGDYIELGLDPSRGVNHIDLAIAEYLNTTRLRPERVRVKQMSFKIIFAADGPARSLSFTVSCPSTCDLKSKSDELRAIGERCLRLWEVTYE